MLRVETVNSIQAHRHQPRGGPGLAQCAHVTLAAAREAGARVRLDCYRRKLWTSSDAQRVVRPLVRHVHLVENGWSALLYDGTSGTLWRGPRYVLRLVD